MPFRAGSVHVVVAAAVVVKTIPSENFENKISRIARKRDVPSPLLLLRCVFNVTETDVVVIAKARL